MLKIQSDDLHGPLGPLVLLLQPGHLLLALYGGPLKVDLRLGQPLLEVLPVLLLLGGQRVLLGLLGLQSRALFAVVSRKKLEKLFELD